MKSFVLIILAIICMIECTYSFVTAEYKQKYFNKLLDIQKSL
jgi:hypothetical protein